MPYYLAHYFNLKIMERKEEGVWIKKQIEQRIRRSSSSRDLSEANRFDCPDNNNNKGAQRTLVVGGPLSFVLCKYIGRVLGLLNVKPTRTNALCKKNNIRKDSIKGQHKIKVLYWI